ncbi:cyclin-dependent kinase inhibitor 1 isoform X2 [Coffea eugenioides]|uniref:cyclin-dependent kinase inhibitor 1 isoform X2 n=1 Tax=Coffea eugenioides TaxID=49369 RepID=UPI000F60DBE0|nr:cyclin-dependent kinase inhibitor 1 isoform X2 [Coffea eugenioides]
MKGIIVARMNKDKSTGEEVAETDTEMTRAVPAASATAGEGRKRKVGCGGELSYATSLVQLRSHRRLRVDDNVMLDDLTGNAAATGKLDDPCSSCCSSNGSSELDYDTSESVDLKVEEEEEGTVEVTTSTYELENRCRERRETAPWGEVQAESGELESTTASRLPSMSSEENSSRCRTSTEEKNMPSKDELEEFFSAAEKNLQQKFAQKYNFDIVKEEPLQGRYEWVRVNP